VQDARALFVTATTRNLSPARHALFNVKGKSSSVNRFGFGFLAETGRPIGFVGDDE
jgi:hypothetical protein